MPKAQKFDHPVENFLLATFPVSVYEKLLPFMETVSLKQEQVVYQADQQIDYVYFPTTAMMSWVAATSEGERIEVGVVGWEGMVGIPELLGYKTSPFGVEVELPGDAIRIATEKFTPVFEELASIRGILFRYVYTALTQLAQSSVCGRYHGVEERLCRWLLMAHDRSEGDELLLTQEILAGMIGARRPAVNIVIGNLQKSGLIQTERGRITIVDRDGMEKTSCECYRVIREAFDKFLETNSEWLYRT